MIESTLANINIFSSIEQYNENVGSIGANDLSLVPTSDGVPTGFVISSATSEIPEGYLLCNGGTVSRSTYPALFAKIGVTYGAGDGITTFNLPNLTDRFIQGSATVGTVKNAGLPNITGTMKWHGVSVQWEDSGAFRRSQVGSGYTWRESTYYGTNVSFDASLSNSIYGNSSTVQPPALTMRFYIKY